MDALEALMTRRSTVKKPAGFNQNFARLIWQPKRKKGPLTGAKKPGMGTVWVRYGYKSLEPLIFKGSTCGKQDLKTGRYNNQVKPGAIWSNSVTSKDNFDQLSITA